MGSDQESFNMSFSLRKSYVDGGDSYSRIKQSKSEVELNGETMAINEPLHGSEQDAIHGDIKRENFLDMFFYGTNVDQYIADNLYGMSNSQLDG